MSSHRSVLARSAGAAALFVLFSFHPSQAVSAGPDSFVQDLGNRAIAVLNSEAITTFAEREAKLHDLLVESFDMKTISRFVLGRHVRSLSEPEFAGYEKLFTDFIVRVYAVRFGGYSGETFEVVKILDVVDGDSIVRTHILLGEGKPPIRADWRVRMFPEGYKIIDVSVEGISMLNTQRAEFVSVIERKGIDGLIDQLRQRLATSPP